MKTTNYTILLPPSEGKIEGGYKAYSSVKEFNYYNNLNQYREHLYQNLISYVKTASLDDLKKLFSITKESLVLQVKELMLNHYQEKTLPAIARYTGVMFKCLDYQSLNQESKTNAESSILFIDGLFGLLKITDLIPNYKLSIGAKFSTSNQMFNITKYWKENLKTHLESEFKGKIIIDLLPQSHREVIDEKIISSHNQYYKINFYEMKNGIPKNSGHISKQLKGEFIRYVLGFSEINLQIVQGFQHSKGYGFSEELSSNGEVVFLRG